METDFSIALVRWDSHSEKLRDVRYRVFVLEQEVPPSMEIDEQDPLVVHALATDNGQNPIGTGRLSDDGRIGRVAVLRSWRNRSVGTAIMESLIDHARSTHLKSVYLHGQVQSMPFYEKLGFVAHGPEFNEAGIAHREMTLEL